MKKSSILKKSLIIGICVLLVSLITPSQLAETLQNQPLPPPQPIDMILEETIFRRASVRDFTDEPVSDQDLATILWTAYGLRQDGMQTTPPINSTHSARIYVCTDHGVYTYEPQNHSLIFYKNGDYTNNFQYKAPIQLGLVWNTTARADENLTAAEIGMIGQNVYLAANALDLATLSTVGAALDLIHLPDNEVPLIIMPLGHPKYPYDFQDKPLVFTLLPRVQRSEQSLSEVLNQSTMSSTWDGTITRQQQAQLLWSAYGYSYYLDRSGYDFLYHINRHRTVPSAHKYYPLEFYAFTATGISQYIPNIYNPLVGPLGFLLFNISWFRYPVFTYIQKIKTGDHRSVLADACEEPGVATAPLIILSVLDMEKTRPEGYDDFSDPALRWLWYYEAGASAENILLETTAWGLSTAILPVHDPSGLYPLLDLDETLYQPLLVSPVGK
jgi:nitroreductase